MSFRRDTLQAPGPIIDCITDGYKLPVLSAPPQFSRLKQHQSAQNNAEFVETLLAELLSNRCAHRVVDDHINVSGSWTSLQADDKEPICLVKPLPR